MVVVADQLMYTGVQTAPVGAEDDIEKLQSFASRYVMSQPTRLTTSILFSEKPRQFMQLTDIIFNPSFQDSNSIHWLYMMPIHCLLLSLKTSALSHGMHYTQGHLNSIGFNA